MTGYNDTAMGGNDRNFPKTHWSLIEIIRSPDTQEHETALKNLIELYWKPIYCWLHRHGYSDADAKDLVQEFFLTGLQKKTFEKADAGRGKFRTYLLTCLKHFAANLKRKPKGTPQTRYFVSIDKMDTTDMAMELADKSTPDEIFKKVWVMQLLLSTLAIFEKECHETGKQDHYTLFYQRIFDPILNNIPQPPMKKLAEEMDLTQKQACNRVITARRAYQQLLRKEIRKYASSNEEVSGEIEDLFGFLDSD
jgi:DNA-directed RNA polymerase specialized sigma24 family protein